MRYIEPVYDEHWCDTREEFISTDTVVGYRVVNDRGVVLGAGETRTEALERAQEHLLLPA